MSVNAHQQENKLIPCFTDEDLMPFGKHINQRLMDVPESYLSWLWHNGVKDLKGQHYESDKVKLCHYIWNSRNAINQELTYRDEPI